MRKSTWVLGVCLLVAFLGAGFWLGRSVSAQTSQPGSAEDPLVSKSYVDEQVGKKITDLESRVTALTTKVGALEKTVQDLQSKLAGQGSGGTSGGTGGGTSGGTGGGSTAPVGIGKTVYVKSGNSYMNIRSGPGTTYALVTKVNPGIGMTVLEVSGQWYKVKVSTGKVGWAASWMVSLTK